MDKIDYGRCLFFFWPKLPVLGQGQRLVFFRLPADNGRAVPLFFRARSERARAHPVHAESSKGEECLLLCRNQRARICPRGLPYATLIARFHHIVGSNACHGHWCGSFCTLRRLLTSTHSTTALSCLSPQRVLSVVVDPQFVPGRTRKTFRLIFDDHMRASAAQYVRIIGWAAVGCG